MNEHDKARAWREAHNLSKEQLAELTGYSTLSIYWFEKGCTPRHGPTPEWVWQRYKRACEGLERELTSRRKFEW